MRKQIVVTSDQPIPHVNPVTRRITATETLIVIATVLTLVASLFIPAARDWYAHVAIATWSTIVAVVSGIWDLWLWIASS